MEGVGERKKAFLFLVALMIGLIVFGARGISARGTVYVDADASGSMDGSEDHPFDSIQDAIDKASDKDRDVFVNNGYYKENIELWSDVKLIGEERGKVVIEADDEDEHTVTMYDDSEVHNLYLTGGRSGIYVKTGAKALVSDCDIIDNEKDGIKAGSAKTTNDEKLEVYGSYIAENGRNGIYVEGRKVYLEGNLIEDNDHDGIEIAKGSEGTIKKGRIKDNNGDGIRVFVDGSELSIDGVTIRDNDKEGIEVRAEGSEGFVHIEDCKFNGNERWAIAKVEKAPFTDGQWSRSLLIENPTFLDSGYGAISHFIQVY